MKQSVSSGKWIFDEIRLARDKVDELDRALVQLGDEHSLVYGIIKENLQQARDDLRKLENRKYVGHTPPVFEA